MASYRNQSSTTPVVLNLLIANVVAFLATTLLFDSVPERYEQVYDRFALHPVGSPMFEWWQPLTYMFLHGDFFHLFFNMFALWMFGRGLEQTMGSMRFFIYYFVCGIGAALVQMGMYEIDLSNIAPYTRVYWEYMQTPTLGASGAVFGLLLAFGMLYPNAVIMLLIPPIPMKAKWFVIIYGAVELFLGVYGSGGVAHFAHLGGMFWGWLLIMWWRRRGARRYL